MSAAEKSRAFPSVAINDQYGGMMLLDWFAGQALAGMLASESEKGGSYQPEWAAERAYQIAAAMLTERAKATGDVA